MGDLAFDSRLITIPTIIGAIIVALIIWRLKVVTFAAAIGMGLFGASVVLFGSLTLLIPLLVFFITSSLLTMLPGSLTEEPERRTLTQVVANGSVAWLAVLAIPFLTHGMWFHHDFHALFVGAIAAANADTWATEIGTRYGRRTRNIVSGRYTPPGTSGAVTSLGTLAAAFGALVVAATYPFVTSKSLNPPHDVLIITGAGFLGSMVDSILGALAQKKFRCRRCGALVETRTHCGTRTSVMSGVLTNDHVNWVCTLVGALVAWWWVGKW